MLGGNASPREPLPDAALGQAPPAAAHERVQRIPIHQLRSSPLQPRKDFSESSLQELSESIKAQGIIQPLVARARGNVFELIAGERRWRAAQLAGLTEVPVIVREADDRAVLELALIENLQRENLNPIEEAHGYAQLIGEFQLTQEDAAAKVGKSRAVVANAVRLLKLAPEVQSRVRDGQLSVGHAKVILGLEGHEQQKRAAAQILKQSLNVRQAEELVARWQNCAAATSASTNGGVAVPPRDHHMGDLQQKLQERFGTKVLIRYRRGKGSIEIRFFADDDLERILKIAGVSLD